MAIIWHGGNRWSGSPEVRPAKKGRAEWGPGIYGTSCYFRASQYAKGGKVTQLVEFAPRLPLRDAAIGLDTLTYFVNDFAPRSKRGEIFERLESAAARNKTENRTLLGRGEMVHADVIVNMWVNTDLASGVKGPLLSEFLVDLGIDGACDSVSSQGETPESWTVIFNPKAITKHVVLPAKDVHEGIWSLPDPRERPEATIQQLFDGHFDLVEDDVHGGVFTRPRDG